jgi:uncharacterized membrane protein (UPF0127 family)
VRLLVAVFVIAASCAQPATTHEAWHGLPVRQIEIADHPMTVAVASSSSEQSKGLSGVSTLESIEGMLFVFPEPTRTRFWMKDTLIPLDIAFFDTEGTLIEVIAMPVCEEDPCPTYAPPTPYAWAVEAPAGGPLERLPAGSILVP